MNRDRRFGWPGSSRVPSVLAAIALVALAVGVVLGAGVAGSATAGDRVAVFDFTPDDAEVEPGDELEIDVTLRSHGQYGDTGVASFLVRLDYPTEYLTVTDVEAGDWFEEAPDGDALGEGQEEVSVSESVDHDEEAGAVIVEQSLQEIDFGVIGAATVATLTVEVNPDADPAIALIDAEGPDEGVTTEVELTDQWPQPLSIIPAELTIDGGDEVVEPAYDPVAFGEEIAGEDDAADDQGDAAGDADDGTGEDGDSGDGSTDDARDDAGDADGADDGGDASNDDVPAPVGASIVGILLTMLLSRWRSLDR